VPARRSFSRDGKSSHSPTLLLSPRGFHPKGGISGLCSRRAREESDSDRPPEKPSFVSVGAWQQACVNDGIDLPETMSTATAPPALITCKKYGTRLPDHSRVRQRHYFYLEHTSESSSPTSEHRSATSL
jgi:hypothetical protein